MPGDEPVRMRELRDQRKSRLEMRQSRVDPAAGGIKFYQHPAHPYLLKAIPRSVGWQCNICLFRQVSDGEQRQRYRSERDGEFNICSDCLSAEYSAWLANKDRFVRGEDIVFPGFQYVGVIDSSEWPDVSDAEAIFACLDEARRNGTIPWTTTEYDNRDIRISFNSVTITGEVSNDRYGDVRLFLSFELPEVRSLTCLDDQSQHFVLLNVGLRSPMCHVFVTRAAELALSVCDTAAKAFDFVHTQAILEALDDSILAALENRSTMVEKKAAEEQSRTEVMMRRPTVVPGMGKMMRARPPSLAAGLGQPSGAQGQGQGQGSGVSPPGSPAAARRAPDEEDPLRRRSSVFRLFVGSRKKKASEGSSKAGAEGDTSVAPAGSPQAAAAAPVLYSDEQKLAMVSNFMSALGQSVSPVDMQKFTTHLSDYRTKGDIEKFKHKLAPLFPAQRRHLLKGMAMFIPERDRASFEAFVAEGQGADNSSQ